MKRTAPRRVQRPRPDSTASGIQQVLDAIARTAARLCEASDALIHQVEGHEFCVVARYGRLRAVREVGETFPLTRGWVAGRAVIEGKTVHVRDLPRAVEFQESLADPRARDTRVRTILATPLVRN